jgi:DDE superfamily endonuclease
MRRDYFYWPDAEERKQLAAETQQRFHLPNAVMIVDGTTFRLSSRPNRADAADYSGRKGGYTITNLFFCDIKRKIRYYVTGWAGCAHDNRMWVNSSIHLRPMDFLAPNEYIIGDSAFANGPHMVTTYKAPTGGLLVGSKKRFNDVLSSPRVISEHVNGILKGRWCWLKGIPNILNEDVESMKRIMRLIDVTVILHNFLIENNFSDDESFFFDEDELMIDGDNESVLGEDDELNQPINPEDPSALRREQIRAYLSEKGII